MNKTFESELIELVNKHSMENASDTPDFILAQYLYGCLCQFNMAVKLREGWYGRGDFKVEGETANDQ